jgi:glutamyl-Q tRNA(Asp) synthetase
MRVRVEPEVRTFIDGIQGRIDACVDATEGDYLIVRRDGLPAYHLAVVVDDAFQGVNTIVRGADLLDSTGVHLHLQKMLKVAEPAYFHVPIVADAFGQKLSKQTGATGVGLRYVPSLANRVLEHLGIHPPSELANAPSRELWPWAVQHTSFKELICRQSIHSQ